MSRGDGDVIRPDVEIESSSLIIDPRTIGQQFFDSLQWPWIPTVSAIVCTAWVFIMPGAFFLALMLHFFFWMVVVDKPDVLPINLPYGSRDKDLNNPRPGGRGYGKADGGFYFGRIITRGRQFGMEVWSRFSNIMQHILIFGTTGAGKTESIVSYLTGFLSVGSGFIFNDAKAAPKAMVQIATIMRIFGRDDDFRVINYIIGGTDEEVDYAYRVSNDLAAFARGTGETITQLLVSLMPASGGDNKIFSERAIALVSAILPALTDLRDANKLQIDPQTIRENMAFEQVIALYRNNHIRPKSKRALLGYLQSLPGYRDDLSPHEQPEEVTRQFGFAQAYFTRTLSSLSDTYGHIYMVGQGEVDWEDAVLHGRGVMTLLPSLEKSGDELANLGKIVLTGVKNGMVVGLGTVFEGSTEDIAYNLPSNTEVPYCIANDETAYMLTESQDIMNAQARGLGFSIITGAQDAPGLLESHSKTTKQIMANSAFKQIQYIDDKETTELAVVWGGEGTILTRERYERQGDGGNYYSTGQVVAQKRNRLSTTALNSLETGEAYIMYKGKLHKVGIFNHGLSEKQTEDPRMCWIPHWYSVRLAKVRLPDKESLSRLYNLDPRMEYVQAMNLVDDDVKQRVRGLDREIHSQDVLSRIAGGAGADEAANDDYYSGFASALLSEPAKLDTISGIEDLFLELLESPNFEFKAEAETAGARKEINDLADDYMFMDDDEFEQFAEQGGDGQGSASGGSTSGGMNQKPTAGASEPDNNDSLLAGFIDGYTGSHEVPVGEANISAAIMGAVSAAQAVNDFESVVFDAETEALINSVVFEPQEDEDRTGEGFESMGADISNESIVLQAVRDNLALMPWVANTVEEVDEVFEGMVQAEMFVLDSDEEEAREESAKSMQKLLDSSMYPKAKPKPISTENLHSLISSISGR